MGEWKRIADEMPPERVPVLCYGPSCYVGDSAGMCVMTWHPRYGNWNMPFVGGQEAEIECKPTHWMPLPASPDSAEDGL